MLSVWSHVTSPYMLSDKSHCTSLYMLSDKSCGTSPYMLSDKSRVPRAVAANILLKSYALIKKYAIRFRILDHYALLHLQQLLKTLYRRDRVKGRHSTPCFLKWRPNQFRGKYQRHCALPAEYPQAKTPHRQKHFGGAAPNAHALLRCLMIFALKTLRCLCKSRNYKPLVLMLLLSLLLIASANPWCLMALPSRLIR